MSSEQSFCSKEEIAQKRLAALAIREKYKKLMKVSEQPSAPHASPGNELTREQRERIEMNRLLAIERAKQNKMITPEIAEGLKSGKILPGKLSPTKSFPGKSEAPSKVILTNQRTNPYPSVKPQQVQITLEATSDDRFEVKLTNGYNNNIISEFKKISSSSYCPKSRNWSFRLTDYEIFLAQLKPFAEIERIPAFVLKVLRQPVAMLDNSCLDSIEPIIAESLLTFQRESVAWGISRGGRLLLADDMGLGKTRQALAIADAFKDDWPLLIVTTAALREMWSKQILELLPKVLSYDLRILLNNNTPISDAKVVICSYAGLKLHIGKLETKGFGMIIFDESHTLKTTTAEQTKYATRLAESANRIICVSGTPALSRPAELYTQLAIIDRHFTDFYSFSKRYCAGHSTRFGWNADGHGNLRELHTILNKKFMIRRTKDEVYMELGDKQRKVVELTVEGDNEEMQDFDRKFKSALGQKKHQDEILIRWYAETAKTKADIVSNYVQHFIESCREKFLVFAHHQVVMNALSDRLTKLDVKFMRIDGSTAPETRQRNVDNFQNDSEMRCALLSIRAASTGLTLTAASSVIFAELDWTPSTIIQAEARAHRIGQENQVKCFFLIAKGTADEVMWQNLQKKQQNLSKIGLVGNCEHLSQNMSMTQFKVRSSTIEENILVSNQAGPSTSKMETCDEEDHHAMSAIELKKMNEDEAKANQDKPQSQSSFDVDFDIEMLEELEEQAKVAHEKEIKAAESHLGDDATTGNHVQESSLPGPSKKNTSVNTSSSSEAFYSCQMDDYDDDDIDWTQQEEIAGNAELKRTAAKELEGIDFEDESNWK